MRKGKLIIWLDALRSGDYTQTRGALRNDFGYCSLGILCDLSKLSSWDKDIYETHKYSYLGQVNYLPIQVGDWAEMNKKEISAVSYFLMALNDQKVDFIKLAEHLEKKYKLK